MRHDTTQNPNDLHLAVRNNNLESVKTLIASGADINALTTDLCTPLHIAAQLGHTEMVEYMLGIEELDSFTGDENGNTALHLAIINGHTETAKLLIEKTYIHYENHDGFHALHLAAQIGNHELLPLLIKNCTDVHRVAETPRFVFDNNSSNASEREKNKYPALHLAAQNGHKIMVEELIKAGADVDQEVDGDTPFNLATRNRHVEVITTLVEYGATPTKLPNYPNNFPNLARRVNLVEQRHAALSQAIKDGNTEQVQGIIAEDGFKIDAPLERDGHNVCNALHIAAQEGHNEIVQILINAGANVNAINNYGSTPLHCAAEARHVEVARILIEKDGINIELANNAHRTTILHYSCDCFLL